MHGTSQIPPTVVEEDSIRRTSHNVIIGVVQASESMYATSGLRAWTTCFESWFGVTRQASSRRGDSGEHARRLRVLSAFAHTLPCVLSSLNLFKIGSYLVDLAATWRELGVAEYLETELGYDMEGYIRHASVRPTDFVPHATFVLESDSQTTSTAIECPSLLIASTLVDATKAFADSNDDARFLATAVLFARLAVDIYGIPDSVHRPGDTELPLDLSYGEIAMRDTINSVHDTSVDGYKRVSSLRAATQSQWGTFIKRTGLESSERLVHVCSCPIVHFTLMQ